MTERNTFSNVGDLKHNIICPDKVCPDCGKNFKYFMGIAVSTCGCEHEKLQKEEQERIKSKEKIEHELLIRDIVDKFPERVKRDFSPNKYNVKNIWPECMEWEQSLTRILIMIGPSTIGKTWNGCNIMYTKETKDFAVYSPEFLRADLWNKRTHIDTLCNLSFLMIDDFDKITAKEHTLSILYEVCDKARRIIMTGNYKSVEEMESRIPETIFKRLLDYGIDGQPRAKILIKGA